MLRVASVCGVLAALTLAAPAIAADFPATSAPVRAPAPAPIYVWTGIYFGGHGGGVWASETSTNVTTTALALAGTQFSAKPTGFLGGGQVGGNYQYGQWVFGVEADGSWTNANETVNTISGLLPAFTVSGTSDMNWFATLTGRFGYAAGNVLFYAKGGMAWMNVDYTASILATGTNLVVPGGEPVTIRDTRNGWTVGGGIEFGFWNNWSAKVEYDYMNFGTQSYVFALGGITSTAEIDSQVHLVKAGINYRFGSGAAVVARY